MPFVTAVFGAVARQSASRLASGGGDTTRSLGIVKVHRHAFNQYLKFALLAIVFVVHDPVQSGPAPPV